MLPLVLHATSCHMLPPHVHSLMQCLSGRSVIRDQWIGGICTDERLSNGSQQRLHLTAYVSQLSLSASADSTRHHQQVRAPSHQLLTPHSYQGFLWGFFCFSGLVAYWLPISSIEGCVN
jgi:hypothetical protein